MLNKADPNLVDKNGNTALHLAAIAGAQDPTLFLLENGAMANAANKVWQKLDLLSCFHCIPMLLYLYRSMFLLWENIHTTLYTLLI